MSSKFRVLSLIIAGILLGVLGTIQLQAIARSPLPTVPAEQIQEFATAYGIIKSGYVEPTDDAKLMEDAIKGMVAALDPHSQYLSAEDYADFMDSTLGKFVGLGIEIVQEDGLVKIVAPIEDTPAFKAGLQPGDLITNIDDADVRDLTLSQAVQRMRGEPNTKVTLTILRKSVNKTFTVTITRAEIHTRSVKSKLIEPGYAWIRISQFQENTVDSFVSHVQKLYQEDPNIKGIVLDLRNDPGGLLNAAVAISSAFLPQDALVVSTRGQAKEVEMYYLAAPQYYSNKVRPPKTIKKVAEDGSVTFVQEDQKKQSARLAADPLRQLPAAIKDVPLVVLVNEGSASASEIVAGALKDHNRATIMGATTFGKGSVQSTIELTEKTALKMTIALYYTPLDHSIQATGIVPDIALPENADGSSPLSVLYTREVDLKDHLSVNKDSEEDTGLLKAEREKALQKLKDTNEDELPKLPIFGDEDDFRLEQAILHLQGKPVITVKEVKKEDSVESAKAAEKQPQKEDQRKADGTQLPKFKTAE